MPPRRRVAKEPWCPAELGKDENVANNRAATIRNALKELGDWTDERCYCDQDDDFWR
jgi:hypothetical protein